MRRAFSLIEIMVVVAVIGIAAAAGLVATSSIIEKARRADEAQRALAQIRKLRADAIVATEVAFVKASPSPTGGVRLTTMTLRPEPSATTMCDLATAGRVTSKQQQDYELIDIAIDQPSKTLCFDHTGFRLLADDHITPATRPAHVDVQADSTGASLGVLQINENGSFKSDFEAAAEGMSATVNLPPIPLPEDPIRPDFDVAPREVEPELPVMATPPPDPTQPTGQPPIEPLPPPVAAAPPPPPPACTVPTVVTDCGAGYDCVAGNCVPAGCVDDSDCPGPTGCNTTTNECTSACNTAICPPLPYTCGGCQGLDCCTQYGCLCL